MLVTEIAIAILFELFNFDISGGEKLRTINIKQAKELVMRCNYVDLKNCEEINDDVMMVLIRARKQLNLSGLKSITVSKAKILSLFKNEIVLDGLESIEPEILTILSGNERIISLNGLKQISEKQAKIFLNFYILSLNGVERLDPAIANIFSDFNGHSISLSGIKKIDTNSLGMLSRATSCFLLNGISKLDLEMANIILNGKADFRIKGLGSISDDCFSTLNNAKIRIELGLKTMTKAQAFGYRNWSGGGEIIPTEETVDPVFVESVLIRSRYVALPHTKFINQRLAIILGGINVRNIDLSGLRRITPDLAYWLGMGYGDLNLSGVTEIDLPCAEYLSYYMGDLNLNGLKKITPDLAEALSKHIGFLDLSGLEELDDISAKKLASHLGAIDLSSINKISDISFFNLSQIKNPNIINVFKKYSTIRSIKFLFWNALILYDMDYYYHYHRITHDSRVLLGSHYDFNWFKLFIVLLQNHNKIACIDECMDIGGFCFNCNGFKIAPK